MIARKGQHFVRKSDGFVFVVTSSSRTAEGAVLQCVDATRIVGWFTFAAIARDFDRLPPSKIVFPVWSWAANQHIATFVDRAGADDFVRAMNNPLRGAATCRVEHASKVKA